MRLSERRLCGLARLVRAERVDRAQRQNSLYGTEAVLDDPRFLAATAKPHPKPGTSSSKTRISDCPGFSLIRATFCSVSRISVGGSNLSERANKISKLTGPTLPRINRKKRAGQTRGRSSAGDRARDALTGHIRGKQITRRARSRLLRRPSTDLPAAEIFGQGRGRRIIVTAKCLKFSLDGPIILLERIEAFLNLAQQS